MAGDEKTASTLTATADQLLEASKLLEGSATFAAETKLEVWAAVVSPMRTKHGLRKPNYLNERLQLAIQAVFKRRGGIPYEHNNISQLAIEVEKELRSDPEFIKSVLNDDPNGRKRQIWAQTVANALKKVRR